MENSKQGQIATCISAGVYERALTRGRQYEILAQDARRQVKVRGDNNRARWYPAGYFDFANNPVPVLTTWHFCDLVDDPLNGRDATNNLVDVELTLSDGTKRWCTLATPDYLKQLLEPPYDPPALWSSHLIVIRDLAEATVDRTLHHIDQQGELAEHTCAIEDSEWKDEEDE